jgi:hypothetical protein
VKIVYLRNAKEEIEFVKRATAYFKEHPKVTTYTDGEIESGCLFAVAWLGRGKELSSILVLEVGDKEPVIYGDVGKDE